MNLHAVPPRPPSHGLVCILLLGSALLMVLGLGVGSSGWEGLQTSDLLGPIVLDIRLPRTLGAWLAGALLGLAGAIAQGLFRNPLADPYILGSSSGAALGVASAAACWSVSPLALAWLARLGLTAAAFVGALAAVLLTLLLAKGVQHTLRLLLAGLVVSVVLGALAALVLLRRPDISQTLQAFMLGSTSLLGWSACALMAAVLALSLLAASAMRPLLDALSLGEATAHSLGLPLRPLRLALVGVLALSSGTAVAQTGLIAFVGLAAPHVVRALQPGTSGRLLLPASLMGAVLLSAADIAARGLLAPQELPVGVLTALLGGAYLLWHMQRQSD